MSTTPGKLAFQRFKKNKAAVAGGIIILAGIFIALFAYFIIPDHSQNANTQIVELKLKKPGYRAMLLRIPYDSEQKVSFWQRLVEGTPQTDRYIPILDYRVEGDNLYFEHYTGSKDQGIWESIQLHRLNPSIRSEEDLNEQIVKEHIVKRRFLLGTDALGRDYFSRLLLGARVSLLVGFMAVVVSLAIGLILGAIAGYFRSWPDDIISYFINIFWSIPTLLLALSLSLVFTRGLSQVFMAIGLTMWVEVARMVRGQFISLRETEFVEAARSLGFKSFRTIFRHMLPNITGPLIVVIASNFAAAILLEAGLSFLGLGVGRPIPSWGTMLSDNRTFLIAGMPHLAILPGMAISLFVLSFFLIGNGLRDAFDVKSN